MTLYLLDENVLREMHPGGNANVRAWERTVDDSDLRLSVMTLLEKRLGWEKRRKSDKDKAFAEEQLTRLATLETAYDGRILPIDEKVAAEWARLLGAKEKNQRDMALAATARVHGLVLVTRNISDFEGRSVQVLNPFKSPPKIVTV